MKACGVGAFLPLLDSQQWSGRQETREMWLCGMLPDYQSTPESAPILNQPLIEQSQASWLLNAWVTFFSISVQSQTQDVFSKRHQIIYLITYLN